MAKISKSVFLFFTILLVATFYFGIKLSQKKVSKNSPVYINFESKKTTKPELKFFDMSFCPYGNQMENILRPVFDLFGYKITITPNYIFQKIDNLPNYCLSLVGDVNKCSDYVQKKYFKNETDCQKNITENSGKCLDEKNYLKTSNGGLYGSLHGRQEANQNIREICAFNLAGEDKKIWWDFIQNVNKNCTSQNADTCWEEQGKSAGYDTNKITECFNKDAVNIIEQEIAITNKYQVSISPTIYINDVLFPPKESINNQNNDTLKIANRIISQNKYRTPNIIKQAICTSFSNNPKECDTELSEITNNQTSNDGCGNL